MEIQWNIFNSGITRGKKIHRARSLLSPSWTSGEKSWTSVATDKHYLFNFLSVHDPDTDQPAAENDQPVHPVDWEPLHDQPASEHDQLNQSVVLNNQPVYPVVNVPAVKHLPDPPDLDQDEPRRSRRVCKKRFNYLDVENRWHGWNYCYVNNYKLYIRKSLKLCNCNYN